MVSNIGKQNMHFIKMHGEYIGVSSGNGSGKFEEVFLPTQLPFAMSLRRSPNGCVQV